MAERGGPGKPVGRFFPERVSGCVTGGVDPETWVYGEWEGRAPRAMWGCTGRKHKEIERDQGSRHGRPRGPPRRARMPSRLEDCAMSRSPVGHAGPQAGERGATLPVRL